VDHQLLLGPLNLDVKVIPRLKPLLKLIEASPELIVVRQEFQAIVVSRHVRKVLKLIDAEIKPMVHIFGFAVGPCFISSKLPNPVDLTLCV
jgi:hypothetical protein